MTGLTVKYYGMEFVFYGISSLNYNITFSFTFKIIVSVCEFNLERLLTNLIYYVGILRYDEKSK